MTRTHDLLITNQLLYQLSYSSIFHFGDDLREYAMLTLTTTSDLLITNQLLYQLSHSSIFNWHSNYERAALALSHIGAFDSLKLTKTPAP